MSNFLEKTLQFGLGLAAYSREKIEELVEEMVRRGEVAGKDARKLAEELVEKGEEQRREIQRLVEEEVRKTLDALGYVKRSSVLTQEDVDRIVREKVAETLRQRGLDPDRAGEEEVRAEPGDASGGTGSDDAIP